MFAEKLKKSISVKDHRNSRHIAHEFPPSTEGELVTVNTSSVTYPRIIGAPSFYASSLLIMV
jgi:hypothetical protein